MMKITYDKIADAMYLSLKKGKITKTIPFTDNLIVDFGKNGEALGIELLSASVYHSKELEKSVMNGIPIEMIASTPAQVLI